MMDQKKIEQINENEKIKEHYIENLEKENNNLICIFIKINLSVFSVFCFF